MSTLIDFVLHIDSHLIQIVNNFGDSTYLILFAIIFIETGAVILPFLPGDSLLFAASALAANLQYHLSIWIFLFVFLAACMLGDSLNFYIGHRIGKSLSNHSLFGKLIDKDSLEKAEHFFEKHGAPAIILARYMPIIRTFAPFAAAGSGFPYRKFIRYSAIGCISWVVLCCTAGYFFGNLPFVQEHFSVIIIAIIIVTLIPAVVSYLKAKFTTK
ncbi:VTT domain-containing protein [Limosilactobacillus fastidiosus]|uniref:VTT domain-containing protein n=1 Tax=Limosilactobacillus fastidiosus TaxID=2759855 RepID=A0A7W3TYL7_9LACO|nr:VTT domain-containing protein [Limosilactobacillus fastidiosus]MBB1062643.1 VTT domain-containing protein [Limosilactobacillus fastidiosus]MBB1085435.1 VTT domain-containing protein [Limosilactobacillus fastidiosus]MCD7083811.1 VTT domain-containing protein [Limosilactobacillus fastidiosus]MCD7085337.1 VTT domain-containing protein [Limosilactobacillus fastidiosus]MCD7114088.1 VTT domain-containing protein [Limosilactobacillus fastidiosus]